MRGAEIDTLETRRQRLDVQAIVVVGLAVLLVALTSSGVAFGMFGPDGPIPALVLLRSLVGLAALLVAVFAALGALTAYRMDGPAEGEDLEEAELLLNDRHAEIGKALRLLVWGIVLTVISALLAVMQTAATTLSF